MFHHRPRTLPIRVAADNAPASHRPERRFGHEMTAIVDIHARQIIDSRGNPTVEVDVTLEEGSFGRAAVPSPAPPPARTRRSSCATATRAATAGQGRRHGGRLRSTARSPTPSRASTPTTQPHHRCSGSSSSTAPPTRDGSVPTRSSASASPSPRRRRRRAGLPLYRYVGGVPTPTVLPVPMMNIINGGAHADNPIDFQEFMIMPVGAASLLGGGALADRRRFHTLKKAAPRQGAVDGGRRRGRFRPQPRQRARRARCSSWRRSKRRPATRPGDDIVLALDCAATEFYRDGAYHLEGEGQGALPGRDGRLPRRSRRRYPIVSIEDGMAEDDFDGWKALTDR
jgi:enolase